MFCFVVSATLTNNVVRASQEVSITDTQIDISRVQFVRSKIVNSLLIARKYKDIIRASCISDKLNRIDILIKSALHEKEQFIFVVKSQNFEEAKLKVKIITNISNSIEKIASEENECVGTTNNFVATDSQKVYVQIETILPEENNYIYNSADIITEPPACSSCVM